MDDQIRELQRKLTAGELVPSEPPRDLTISVAPNYPPLRDGDIEILGGAPYLVSEVTTDRAFQVAKIRRLVEMKHGSDLPAS